MIFGVTGTRLGLTAAQARRAEQMLRTTPPDRLHHGDCVGADADIHRIAERLGIKVTIHPPDSPARRAFCDSDDIRDALPYLVRDRNIAYLATHLLAFPDGPERTRSGTWTTVRYALQYQKPVTICYPDGELEYR